MVEQRSEVIVRKRKIWIQFNSFFVGGTCIFVVRETFVDVAEIVVGIRAVRRKVYGFLDSQKRVGILAGVAVGNAKVIPCLNVVGFEIARPPEGARGSLVAAGSTLDRSHKQVHLRSARQFPGKPVGKGFGLFEISELERAGRT